MLTSDFDYHLPPELIAQEPPATRGDSRMLVLHRSDGCLEHRHINDLASYLRPHDLLVLNDTKVFPARLHGNWHDTGGAVELLLVEPLTAADAPPGAWICLARSGRPTRAGLRVVFAGASLEAELLTRHTEGSWCVRFDSTEPLMDVVERIGMVPVPPYIRRDGDERLSALDRERYQTIYARETGAVAAPTAGLHFTQAHLDALRDRGVGVTHLTLHVGPGTFKPVKCDQVELHRMDAERYTVPDAAASAIHECRARGGRVVAVGSTSVRALESAAALNQGEIAPCKGSSTLFIRPPYRFLATDILLTNFHLPRSTLLMMVAALAGHERTLAAYREAVARHYRFFSYGDSMLII